MCEWVYPGNCYDPAGYMFRPAPAPVCFDIDRPITIEENKMDYPQTDIDVITARIRRINTANGWRDEPLATRGERLMLIVTETAEAMEAVRKGDEENYAEELADILIRVLDVADIDDVDIADEVHKKLKKNEGRGYRHGGKAL